MMWKMKTEEDTDDTWWVLMRWEKSDEKGGDVISTKQ